MARSVLPGRHLAHHGAGRAVDGGTHPAGMWTAPPTAHRRSPSGPRSRQGNCSSVLGSSSMLTSLNVTTRTDLTNRAGR